MRIDARRAEGFSSRTRRTQEVVEEIIQRRQTASQGKDKSAESVLRNDIGFDLPSYIRTETKRMTTVGPANGVLKLIEFFVGSLWHILRDAQRLVEPPKPCPLKVML